MSGCTPEYNAKTKEMMRELAELRRVDAAYEAGDFGPVIRAKAKAMVELGETDPGKIVNAVHRHVNQYAEHSREEVANAISGYGKEQRPTTDPLQRRLNAVRAELRDLQRTQDELTGVRDPDAKAKRARETSLRNQIADLDRRIEARDYAEKQGHVYRPTEETLRLREERKAKAAELSQFEPPPAAIYPRDNPRNAARIRQLEKQSAAMREQIQAGHAEKPGKRPSVQYDPKTEQARLERDRLKRQIEALIAKGERSNRSLPRKIADLVTAGHLFNMFTSVMVIPKLAAAVVGGHGLALGQMGVTSALKAISPKFKAFAEQSASQGAGLNLESLKGRLQGLGEAPKTAAETLHHGESRFEAAYGDTAHMSDAYYAHQGNIVEALRHPLSFDSAETILSVPGRTHGMIKQFLSQPEFRQAQVDAKLMIAKRMEAAGKTPEEIHEYLGRDTTQATVDGIAMARAYEAKMQGKNRLNESITNVINQLNKSDNPAAAVTGWALRQILPVTRVGPNVVKQATSMVFGIGKAAAERYAKGEMTPERRDYIVKNIAQNGVGLGLLAIGMVYNEMFGGVPGAGKKSNVQKDDEGNPIKPDEADIKGIPVGAWGFHGAPASMLQIGAGIVHVFKEEMQKDNSSAVNAALLSIGSNLKNWTERTLPYTDLARRTSDTLEYARGGRQRGYPYGTPWGEVAGNQLRSMIEPLALQQYAQSQDEYKKFRKPHNMKQDLELGLPGEEFLGMPGRESVPKR